MAIISALVLLNASWQVNQGFFCLGCRDSDKMYGETEHFRIKYTTKEMSEHIVGYGQVERRPSIPGMFMHISKDQITL
jgi:hypothetical protein